MDRLEQQEYIQSLKKQKHIFCKSMLDGIASYEQAINEINNSIITTETETETKTTRNDMNSNGDLMSHSKSQLIEMINNDIDNNDELQNDMQYLLHTNPTTYDNVKRYIKHMKQQSMARMSQINNNSKRHSNSQKLPHPPRRLTDVNQNKHDMYDHDIDTDNDDINMLHFVVSSVNWKVTPTHKTLKSELLTNDICPIPTDLYENIVNDANKLVKHPMNVNKYKFSIDEILVIKLYCGHNCNVFSQEFSKCFHNICSNHHRSQYYQTAKIFHTVFEYKSVPIYKFKLQHLLPSTINNFGYIVKAIEIGWILNTLPKKYLVFNCSDDILQANDRNRYEENETDERDHMLIIKKLMKESHSSWNKYIMLSNYGWNNIKQLLLLPYLFHQQYELNNKSLFEIFFYEHKLYKMVLSKTFCDRKEINGDVYTFLFNHIQLSLNENKTDIILDLSKANANIFTHKPSYFKINSKLSFNDENINDMLLVKDSCYQSNRIGWRLQQIDDNCNYNDVDDDDDDYKSLGSSDRNHDADDIINEFAVSIQYLDSILNVNGLLKVITNSYYNEKIKNNKLLFEVEMEYRLTIGYENNNDLQQQCYKTSPTLFFKIKFNDLMKIFYFQLIKIVKNKLLNLAQRIEFCQKHKSFIILSLLIIYNCNYNYVGDKSHLICGKSLFEYLFFDCHHYELSTLFPRNHDLLLMQNYNNNSSLIQYDKNKWCVELNAMPKLVHFYENKSSFPKRIIVYLSIDVECKDSNVKWKEYFVNPYLCETKQIIINNIIIESCCNWNNILLRRKEKQNENKNNIYPMIMLYYKISCEYQQENGDNNIYTIESSVRTIHISTEIDMELSENQIVSINEFEINDNLHANDIENKLLICDNLILHENAKLYTSYFNIKCNNLIDIGANAGIIADYRGLKGRNCTFNNNNNNKYGAGGDCYCSQYLNRSEIIFGCGGDGGYINNYNNDDIINIKYDTDTDTDCNGHGLFHYLGCNFGTSKQYKNPFETGFVDLFCGGIGTRSNKIQNILNNHNDNNSNNNCYFISGKSDIWFAIDLKFCKIQLTHYRLHHVNVNSHFLRNWVLESKNINDRTWNILSQHNNDHSINESDGVAIFKIDIDNDDHKNNEFYQYFRIRMTGENSFICDKNKQNKKKKEKTWNILNLEGVFENMQNNGYILCCSGIEFYGNVILTQNYYNYNYEIEKKEFKYKYDFDRNGILYWIGCNYGNNIWCNPSQSLAVKVYRGKQSEKGSVDDIVGREKVEKQCYFLDYFIIDFREINILANKYTLRMDTDKDDHCWTLKASHNGINWKILRQHINERISETASFHVDIANAHNAFYRYFKIENNSMLSELHCCGFEMYGMIKYNQFKYEIPQLKSGGNGGGIINLMAPKCQLNDCIISVNGENGTNCGGGGAAGNILIDCNELQILGNNTRIQAIGGKGQPNVNNDGQNGNIRLYCNQIYGDIAPEKCCHPKPFIL